MDEETGDCFYAAFKYIADVGVSDLDGKRFTLVHGNVAHLPQRTDVNHAWVEEGDTVHEVSNGQNLTIPKAAYYSKFGVTTTKRYTVLQAMANVGDGNYGPW